MSNLAINELGNTEQRHRNTTMTRVKETAPGSGDMPQYKSPPSRINISLRKAYDNQRQNAAIRSKQLLALRGKNRDLALSRDKWKAEAKESQTELAMCQQELATARRVIEELEAPEKKRSSRS